MKSLIAVVCLVVSISGLAWGKGDALVGKTKSATCVACHGQGGNSVNPLWPNLCGQKDQYIVAQLKAFKHAASGKATLEDFNAGTARNNVTMAPMALALTDEDMEHLAAYFSTANCK